MPNISMFPINSTIGYCFFRALCCFCGLYCWAWLPNISMLPINSTIGCLFLPCPVLLLQFVLLGIAAQRANKESTMTKRDSTQATQPCHINRIKTGSMIYDYRRKAQYSPQATAPWLQLKRHWLEQAGFNIDSPVTVRVMRGCLVLTME